MVLCNTFWLQIIINIGKREILALPQKRTAHLWNVATYIYRAGLWSEDRGLRPECTGRVATGSTTCRYTRSQAWLAPPSRYVFAWISVPSLITTQSQSISFRTCNQELICLVESIFRIAYRPYCDAEKRDKTATMHSSDNEDKACWSRVSFNCVVGSHALEIWKLCCSGE